MIVLDYDEINDLKQLHDAISSVLSSVAWYWHTSFSHTTEQARIRLYIPLNERISADDYRKYTKVLANKIGIKWMKVRISQVDVLRYQLFKKDTYLLSE